MHFAAPLYFLFVLVALPCLWFAARRRKALGHSQVSIHDGIRSMPLLGRAPSFCRVLFIAGLIVIATQPQLINKLVHLVFQTRDFLITVDTSGSMSGQLKDPDQLKFAASPTPTTTPTAAPVNATTPDPTAVATAPAAEKPKVPTRAMAAKEAVRQFLLRRKNDRVGLITFDDRCYYSEPIGKPEAVTKKLDAILRSGSGTNFDGPSSTAKEPGAIQCSIQHFVEMHATKTRVLVMVTDGEDSIDADRAQVLGKAIHDEHIKMYVLGVGESWNGSTKQKLQEFVERPEVGGQVIKVGDSQQMREAFELIDKLETSKAETEVLKQAEELYQYFAAAAFLLLLFWAALSAYVREPL
jgi:von Willebrand factor type A domain